MASTVKRYLLPAGLVAIAVFATAAIPFTGAPSYLLVLLAIFATAWYGGLMPAILATVLAVLFNHIFLGGTVEDETIRLTLLVSGSIALSVWAHREKNLRRKLKESDRRFRLVLENVADYAIILTDPAGTIVDWSSGAEQIIGMDASDKGSSLRMIFLPHEAGAFEEEVATANEAGRAGDERWHLRKNGSPFWGYGILTALRGHDGNIKGYVKILRDLTEEKLAEDERKTLISEIEKTNAVLEQMVATLAHDIRAPLSTILGWTSLRKRGALKDDPDLDRAFESIEKRAREQLELMEGLLQLARVKAGKGEPDFKPCDVNAVLRDAMDTILPTVRLRHIQLHAALSPDAAVVPAHRPWLTQIFTNILSNAVKFTPAHGSIRVVTVRTNSAVFVEICDTGPGIAAHRFEQIFDPFKRGSEPNAGAGLGLAIVKELVERHGGITTVRSAGPGKGTTFSVQLPMTPGQPRRLAS